MDNPRPFTDYLRDLDKGRLSTELSSRFQDLIQAVAEHGKAGSIILKISLTPQTATDSEVVSAKGEITIKAPQPQHSATLFYVDDHFNLSRRDPRQFDLEDVSGPRPLDSPKQPEKEETG